MDGILGYGGDPVQFDPPLVEGRLLRRYKRFLVDVRMPDGETVVAHSTNTGSLLGCLQEGAPVLLEAADRPERKLKWTWKMVRVGDHWVGVDTSMAVPMVLEAVDEGTLAALGGYARAIREVKYGREGRSRIDILLSDGGTPTGKGKRAVYDGDRRVYVEVKSTTLRLDRDGQRLAAFPDAVTERGLKHLHELRDVLEAGHRAALVFCAQRSDVDAFVPADQIHAEYGKVLREVIRDGVEVFALAAEIGPSGARLARPLELIC
ncbi:MAG: DNA/RNA nuclease SfsA [Myxococcales bacterium]|nr:DNA/RNA nuclease SfsA [Myxococcales bacterium]